MSTETIEGRVRHFLPFLSDRHNHARAVWNATTVGFNPHIVNSVGKTSQRDVIHTFWSAAPLSGMNKLALTSMVKQRHPVTLYTYDDVGVLQESVPPGVLVRHATTVLPRELYQRCLDRREIRYFSDIFRYVALYQYGGWWLDTDVVLLQPLAAESDHVFSTQWSGSELGHVCVGDVMRAPAGSPHMRALYERAFQQLQDSDDRGFGAVSPVLLTEYVFAPEQDDLCRCLLPPTHFNSIDWTEAELFLAEDRAGFNLLKDERIVGIHLWSKAWADRNLSFEAAPETSVVGYLKRLFGTDFYLDQLASSNDSDKSTRYRDRFGHGYVRIYRDVLDPWILRDLNLLEIGLCRGLVEGWAQDQVPSLLTWLTYLPNARVVGADIQDFSWFSHPRAQTFQIDQSSRSALEAFALQQTAPFDIIIDDASHASGHQQLTLGVLFAKLKPGGVYIIEDLDWQPEEFESADVSKTKDLLHTFADAGDFASPLLSEGERRALREGVASITFHDSHSELLFRGLHRGFAVIQKKQDGGEPKRSWISGLLSSLPRKGASR